MSLLSAMLLTGAVGCGILGVLYFQTYREARRTMEAQLLPNRRRNESTMQRFEVWFADTGPGGACAAYLAKAGLPMSPLKYAAILSGIATGLYAFATRFLQVGGLGGASLVLFAMPFLTQAYLRSRRQQFLKQLQSQLPEVAMMMSNALKAGQSITQALLYVTEHAKPPVNGVFRRCREEIELGRPLEEILKDLIARYDSPDLRLMLAAMLIQKQTGGNLIAALDGIAGTIRKRQETLGEVQATIAQAQQSVRILPFLPFLCGLMFNVALPGFLLPLFTIPGLLVLAVVIPLQVGAAIIIRRITQIEV